MPPSLAYMLIRSYHTPIDVQPQKVHPVGSAIRSFLRGGWKALLDMR